MRSLEHRVRELERRQQVALRRVGSSPAIYTVIHQGKPRPNVAGPVYHLVPAQ